VCRGSLALLLATAAVGCAAGHRGAPHAVAPVALLPEHALLDVQIQVFDPGLPENEADPDPRVYPAIRKAEATYFPCVLRETLVGTRQWGAVEITPRRSDALEVTVQGTIVRSDGARLELDIRASDATGRRWIDKRYEVSTTAPQHEHGRIDPYQGLFNAIAKDLVTARSRLTDRELRHLRSIAELRFASEFAPETFGGYLEDDDGTLRIVRLPARDDPTVALLAEVRGRESMFVATQSGHYARFCSEMAKPYADWRKLAREEAEAYSKVRRQAVFRKAASVGLAALTVLAAVKAPDNVRGITVVAGAAGTIGVWMSGRQKQTEADFHKDTLEELDRSFEAEVHPMVVAVEGRTVKLTGTVEEQYKEWRRLLRELYEAEAGMPQHMDMRIEDVSPTRLAPAGG
jgi:hypothetical protein